MNEIKRERIIGVILAGGTAERLGQALKANLKVHGKTLLERVVGTIGKDCDHLILSCGAHAPSDFNVPKDVAFVADDGRGPAIALANVTAFVQRCHPETDFLAVVAVDAPFLPPDFIARARQSMTPETDVVVGAYEGQTYPTNALWRLTCLAGLPGLLNRKSAPGSLFGLLEGKKWRTIDYGGRNEADGTSQNPFANINTPADLVACNRRAGAPEKQTH